MQASGPVAHKTKMCTMACKRDVAVALQPWFEVSRYGGQPSAHACQRVGILSCSEKPTLSCSHACANQGAQLLRSSALALSGASVKASLFCPEESKASTAVVGLV